MGAGIFDFSNWFGGDQSAAGQGTGFGGILSSATNGFSSKLDDPLFVAGLQMLLTPRKQEAEGMQRALSSAIAARKTQREGEAWQKLTGILGGGVPNPITGSDATPTDPPVSPSMSTGAGEAIPMPPPRPGTASSATAFTPPAALANAPRIAQAGGGVQSSPPTVSAQAAGAPMLAQMPANIRGALPTIMGSEGTRAFGMKLIEPYLNPNLKLDTEGKQLSNEKTRREMDGSIPTDVQRNYAAAVKQGYAGTLMDYQEKLREKTLVTGENEYDKTMGVAQAKRFNDLQDAARNAGTQLGTLRLMEQMTNKPEFYSGFGANFRNATNRALVGLGVQGASANSPNEVFQALSNQTTMDGLGGSLGTAISNADRDFIRDTVPNIANTPDGNRQLIAVRRALAERQQDVARLARDYAKRNGGRLDAGFEDQLAQWGEKNPIFTDWKPPMAQPAPKTAPAPQSAPQVRSLDDVKKLRSGDTFTDPNGVLRRVP